MKKILKKLVLCLLIIPCVFMFSACGKDGLSAYELWKQYNPTSTMTEEEWLNSLIGEKGDSGEAGKNGVNGTDGKDGEDSISSYNVWLEAFNNNETELNYVDWLKANFQIVIDEEKYAINKNLLNVLEVSCYTSLIDLQFNTNVSTSGSGVIFDIDDNGDAYVVTNYHVAYYANGANKAYPYFKLKFYGQDNYHYMRASFIGGSSTYDIAVLKVDAANFISNTNATGVTFSNQPLSAGTPVVAIGNSNGKGINVSRGVVDIPSEMVSVTVANHTCDHRLIRHDAYIVGGNSGGGLFDLEGNLVGITNGGKKNDTDNQTKYAIPADVVQRIANQLIESHKAGAENYKLKTVDLKITNEIYDKFSSYNSKTGVVELIDKVKVDEINSNSIFANDLVIGDIYLSMTINGEKTEITREYLIEELLLDLRVNDILKIEVKRKVSDDEYEILEFSKQVLEADFVVVK